MSDRLYQERTDKKLNAVCRGLGVDMALKQAKGREQDYIGEGRKEEEINLST